MSEKMISITKGVNPGKGKSVTIFFNGEDVSYKCRAALVPETQNIEGDGWIDTRWSTDSPVERLNGRTMWREG